MHPRDSDSPRETILGEGRRNMKRKLEEEDVTAPAFTSLYTSSAVGASAPEEGTRASSQSERSMHHHNSDSSRETILGGERRSMKRKLEEEDVTAPASTSLNTSSAVGASAPAIAPVASDEIQAHATKAKILTPNSRIFSDLATPFEERMIDQLCSMAEDLVRAGDISAGIRELLMEIVSLRAKLAKELEILLGTRFTKGLRVGKIVPPLDDTSLNTDVNDIRATAANKCLRELIDLLHKSPSYPDEGHDQRVVTRLNMKLQILSFAAKNIEPGTENALAFMQEDVQAYEGADLLTELAELYCEQVLTYPFKRLFCKPADELMANLRKFNREFSSHSRSHSGATSVGYSAAGKDPYQAHNIRFQSRFRDRSMFEWQRSKLAIIHNDSEYEDMDVLVDIFQEEQRLAAKRSDKELSPLGFWKRKEYIRSSLSAVVNKYSKMSSQILRDYLYASGIECTQFKPSLMVTIIREYHAHRVLDFSAGWGDRLAGAIAANVELYKAFDPNTNLKAGHRAMVERFVAVDMRQRFQIEYIGFEKAVLRDEEFDLVFTSPPFFDFEIYTSLPGQSVDIYRNINDWLVHFLLSSMKKAWKALCTNGHMIIHITDVFKTKVCEPMCLLAQSQLPNVRCDGFITSVGKQGRPRPMWVFKKTKEPVKPDLVEAALSELRRIFPDVHRVLLNKK